MKILIVHLGNSEHFLLMTSVISHLKKVYTDCVIELIYTNNISKEYLTNINNIFKYPDSFFKQYKFIRNLTSYDLFIDVQREEFNYFRRFVKFIKASKKIGYNKVNEKKPFNFPLTKLKEKHLLDYYYKVFDSLSLKRPKRKIHLLNDTELKETPKKNKKSVLINIEKDGWDDKIWFQFLTNHNVNIFKIYLRINRDDSQLKSITEKKLKYVEIIENNVNSYLGFVDYIITEDHLLKFLSSEKDIPIIQFANSNLVEMEYPLSTEYYVLKPKGINKSMRDISFDSALLVFREMTIKW